MRTIGPIVSIVLMLCAPVEAIARPPENSAPPQIGGCAILPANNIWNTPIDNLPVHARSEEWVNAVGAGLTLHADFGAGLWDGHPIGIPYNVVAGSTVTKYYPSFWYPDESDAGPYPIPANPLIEGGSDAHLLTIDSETCTLYELYAASWNGSNWDTGSGAIFPLDSNALRSAGYTSADAAGLPILPGLVRYEEVAAGEIDHALRITVSNSQAGYQWPARHDAPYNASSHSPVMGARLRLKAGFDITPYPPDVQVLLVALKKYGAIVADNGTSWYISGVPDERWNNDHFHLLQQILGSNLEFVDESMLMIDSNSGQARQLTHRVWIPFAR